MYLFPHPPIQQMDPVKTLFSRYPRCSFITFSHQKVDVCQCLDHTYVNEKENLVAKGFLDI